MSDEAPSHVRQLVTGAVAYAAIATFFTAPIWKFAEPGSMADGGTIMALAISLFYLGAVDQSKRVGKLTRYVAAVFAAYGLSVIGPVWLRAYEASRTNDRRCIAIQRMMLAPNPIRDDGPDLFQALGCRPQNLPFTEWPTKVARRPIPINRTAPAAKAKSLAIGSSDRPKPQQDAPPAVLTSVRPVL